MRTPLGAPDTDRGWFKVARDWAVIFSRVALTPVEGRIIWWVMLNTYGVVEKVDNGQAKARKSCEWTVYSIAVDLRTDRHHVRYAMHRLFDEGILSGKWPEDGGRGTLELNRDFHGWKTWDRKRRGGPITKDPFEGLGMGPTGNGEDAPEPPEEVASPAAEIPAEVPELPAPTPKPAAKPPRSKKLSPDVKVLIVPSMDPVAPSGPYLPIGVAKHDPLLDRPYTWDPRVTGDWWWQPHVPLPGFEVLQDACPMAVAFVNTPPADVPPSDPVYQDWLRDQVGVTGDRNAPKRWAVIWRALSECSSNFCTGTRKGLKAEDLAEEFWDLLRRVRVDACVRMRDEDERPATLLRALARLRTCVAMCDADDNCKTFWRDRVKSLADMGKSLDSMLKQVAEADWREREDRFLAGFGA